MLSVEAEEQVVGAELVLAAHEQHELLARDERELQLQVDVVAKGEAGAESIELLAPLEE